jgi:hypothetical protein
MNTSDDTILFMLIAVLGGSILANFTNQLTVTELFLFSTAVICAVSILGLWGWDQFSKSGKQRKEQNQIVRELPVGLTMSDLNSIRLGQELELKTPIYLPDSIRTRHVHIIGATGSGKTESVILNFLKQDTARGLGAIILDAKGDASFLNALKSWVPDERLKVFDLGSGESATYDPLADGTPMESAQRLFASMTWSEEYYRSKAFSCLQRIFQSHSDRYDRNPRILEISHYLEEPDTFAAMTTSETYPRKLAEKDFADLSGLRDQVRTLTMGDLRRSLSPDGKSEMDIEGAGRGDVLYFRLQSLISSQLVSTVGRLVINHLNFLAGTIHRKTDLMEERPIIPTYLDEFASFVCPEFADLISKARSAKLALHFSHQSVGDLTDLSPAFLNRITDNSATKIVMRINDPDSAEYFARTFGTRLYQKMTQRITNVKELDDNAEAVGEGTQREAHQFRASPDLLKTLPTGVGSVLIAHGFDTPHGASTVLKIRFPKL